MMLGCRECFLAVITIFLVALMLMVKIGLLFGGGGGGGGAAAAAAANDGDDGHSDDDNGRWRWYQHWFTYASCRCPK